MATLPEPLIVVGLKLQVVSAGNPEQAKFTELVKPSKEVMDTFSAPTPPGFGMVMVGLLALSVKSGCRVKDSC
jgi:hypothetical protein